MSSFFERNTVLLQDFARLSQRVGARRDYVQGGGGNTSVKLDEKQMAVKASGYCLGDIAPQRAYAVMDYAALRAFYMNSDPASLEDAERSGSEQAKASTLAIEGLAQLRPSVEAGFHSLLDRFVIHSHSVYANLACCAVEMEQILKQALEGATYAWGMVPYIDPGARLSFAIRDELARVERKAGQPPTAIFMQNHGLIVHAETADACLNLHEDVNRRLCAFFDIAPNAFLQLDLGQYIANCLRESSHTGSFFIDTPLYPDQMVFFIGTLGFGAGEAPEGKVLLDLTSGKIRSAAGETQTRVVTETLAAILFIEEHMSKNGYTLSTMGEQAKRFIANWESEKYRKSLLGAKV